MLTIGQLANAAGVTVRAVRHYHQRGLLAEPERDASGYRRYDADDVVRLIRIRVLAAAGVPLARIATLLDAGPDEFAVAVDDIDAALRGRIRALQEHRRRVRQLRGSEGLALPDDVVEYLALLRRHGVGERTVRIERDSWILLAGSVPDRVGTWIASKRRSLDDAEYVAMYRTLDAALDWDVDDPRLEGLADDLSAYIGKVEKDSSWGVRDDDVPAEVAALLDAKTLRSAPAWRRLVQLVTDRGASGWTTVGSD